MNNKKLFAISTVLVVVLIIPLISQAQRGGMGGLAQYMQGVGLR